MGNLRLSLDVELRGFSGPTAVKNFDATEFIKDLTLGINNFGSWSNGPILETGREFIGESTERYAVEQKGIEYAVKDTLRQDIVFGLRSEALCQSVCDHLNELYERECGYESD